MELVAGELRLRRWRDADVPAIAHACDDPATARFIPHMPSPYTESDAREYVRTAQAAWAQGERLPFAIADSTTDTVLGSIELRLGESGAIGYWVAPWARGRGIATRALVLLSRWAIQERGVERLALTADPGNIASHRVAEKAGFVREGILRSHTRCREGRRDSVLYSLSPSDLA